jgi:hypothetical protein
LAGRPRTCFTDKLSGLAVFIVLGNTGGEKSRVLI